MPVSIGRSPAQPRGITEAIPYTANSKRLVILPTSFHNVPDEYRNSSPEYRQVSSARPTSVAPSFSSPDRRRDTSPNLRSSHQRLSVSFAGDRPKTTAYHVPYQQSPITGTLVDPTLSPLQREMLHSTRTATEDHWDPRMEDQIISAARNSQRDFSREPVSLEYLRGNPMKGSPSRQQSVSFADLARESGALEPVATLPNGVWPSWSVRDMVPSDPREIPGTVQDHPAYIGSAEPVPSDEFDKWPDPSTSVHSVPYEQIVGMPEGYQPPFVPEKKKDPSAEKLPIPFKQKRAIPAHPTVTLVKNQEVMDRDSNKLHTRFSQSHSIVGLEASPAEVEETIPIPARSSTLNTTLTDSQAAWPDEVDPPPRLVGVGLLVERDHQDYSKTRVAEVLPGYAADDNGVIQIDDQIEEVDGLPINKLSLDEVRRLILGEEGSICSLKIFRGKANFFGSDGKRFTVDLLRAQASTRILDSFRPLSSYTQEYSVRYT